MAETTLYDRLGGYDAIAAVATGLLRRLHADQTIGRFWRDRGTDGIAREKQLLIDFLANASGGPMLYVGRGLLQSHAGMGITDQDWELFLGYLNQTLDEFSVPEAERSDLLSYLDTTRPELVNV